MHTVLSVEDALHADNPLFIDVRTPAEFSYEHLPNAVNVPIFSNEERAVVGKLYKQVSVDAAKQQGLEYVSPKLPHIIQSITNYAIQGYEIIVYCWRGGMRSRSVVSLLHSMGIPAAQLAGGYKAYRCYVLSRLQALTIKPQAIVLYGPTGVGKTEILCLLEAKGVPVVNLEKLANHRGSAFGKIGLGMPTTAPLFDAAILERLEDIQPQAFFITECESRRIGDIFIPDVLFRHMGAGKRILLQADLTTRVERLLAEYGGSQLDVALVKQSIAAISHKLGKKKINILYEFLAKNQLEQVVTLLLTDYYDRLYGFDLTLSKSYDATINATTAEQAAEEITAYAAGLKA